MEDDTSRPPGGETPGVAKIDINEQQGHQDNQDTATRQAEAAEIFIGEPAVGQQKGINPCLTKALAYATNAQRPLYVFPVKPGEKKSRVSGRHATDGLNWGATTNPERIEGYWKKWSDSNVAIVTGELSGTWVLETDTVTGHGVDGETNLRKLYADHNEAWPPKTLTARSPSGSAHYYFTWPEGDVIIRNSDNKLAAGVDVRAEGGMVIAPPSFNPKYNARYEWVSPPGRGIVKAPEWLIKLLAEKPVERKPSEPQAPIGKLAAAMDLIPNHNGVVWEIDDRKSGEVKSRTGWEGWNDIMMALFRATGGSDEGFTVAEKWCQKNTAKFNAKYTHYSWYRRYRTSPPKGIGAGTLFMLADNEAPGWRRVWEAEHPVNDGDAATSTEKSGVTLDDFVAYMPLHSYIYIPTREPWPGSSVNSRIPPVVLLGPDGKPVLDDKRNPKLIPANAWLDKNRPVEQMTWAPGLPMQIRDQLVADGGWFERKGVTCFNLYRPPTIVPGDATDIEPWQEHLLKIYPADADHIQDWLAHRVQRPQEKINHALVFGGNQGIGKDTILEPVKRAIGPWNFAEVTPSVVTGRFNGFLKSVILRVNEARDLGEVNRFQFYEHIKPYTAAPPDVLRVDEKNLREHNVFNVCGVIITTNYKTDGIYLPADDRRHYVAWSDRTKEDFPKEYWPTLWGWYDNGGDRNVAAYLAKRDISSFDPKAPPPKTEAFWAIVNSNRAPEEGELADILDELKTPKAVTIAQIVETADGDMSEWLTDRRNRKAIPHRLEKCGYVAVRNEDATDGLWKIAGKRMVVYAKSELTPAEQIDAVHRLQDYESTRVKDTFTEAAKQLKPKGK